MQGPIDAFWAASGLLTENLGPKWNALVVFAEEVGCQSRVVHRVAVLSITVNQRFWFDCYAPGLRAPSRPTDMTERLGLAWLKLTWLDLT